MDPGAESQRSPDRLAAARLARLGIAVGAAFPISELLIAVGLLLPPESVVQYVLFGLALLVGAFIGWLGIPIWTLMLGRHALASR